MVCACQLRPPLVVRSTTLGTASTEHTPGAGQRTEANEAVGCAVPYGLVRCIQVLPPLTVRMMVALAPTATHSEIDGQEISARLAVVGLCCNTQRGLLGGAPPALTEGTVRLNR